MATPFGSTVMSPMGENGLARLEGGSESSLRVKADWNCLLHILAFSFVSRMHCPYGSHIDCLLGASYCDISSICILFLIIMYESVNSYT